jgi:hypothetical protein
MPGHIQQSGFQWLDRQSQGLLHPVLSRLQTGCAGPQAKVGQTVSANSDRSMLQCALIGPGQIGEADVIRPQQERVICRRGAQAKAPSDAGVPMKE